MYRKVGAVFNHERFYGNIQKDDSASGTKFELENQHLWKQMDPKLFLNLKRSHNLESLLESSLDCERVEIEVENVLKSLIRGLREEDN